MNRCQVELQAMARRMGARSVAELMERRSRDRRAARLRDEWEREQRWNARRAGDIN